METSDLGAREERWTEADDAALAALTEKRERVRDAKRRVLRDAVDIVADDVPGRISTDDLTDAIVPHATMLRDALTRFIQSGDTRIGPKFSNTPWPEDRRAAAMLACRELELPFGSPIFKAFTDGAEWMHDRLCAEGEGK